MKRLSQNNNDVVMLELDRPRELRFGHKAIKTLQAITGKSIDAIGEDFNMDELEKYIYCGLLSDARANNETLTLEQMEDLLDMVPFQYYLEKFQEAMGKAFGTTGNSEGNDQKATEKVKE